MAGYIVSVIIWKINEPGTPDEEWEMVGQRNARMKPQSYAAAVKLSYDLLPKIAEEPQS